MPLTGLVCAVTMGRPMFSRSPSRAALVAMLVFVSALSLSGLASGSGEVALSEFSGRSLVRHYSSEEYGGTPQIWNSAQDSNGFLYFVGTGPQLLHYDGARWRGYKLPIFPRYLLVDQDDTIYVGGTTDLGYFDRAQGEFVSILDRLPEDQQDFQRLWAILKLDRGVLFCTARYLYLYEADGSFQVLAEDATASFQGAFVWQERLYVDTAQKGLLVLRGDALEEVSGAGRDPLIIAAVLPYDDSSALVLSRYNGTFLLRRDGMEPFPVAADPFLREHQPGWGFRATDGRFVIATLRGGVVIMDHLGKILETFDESRDELLSNTIYHALEDLQGNFWFSTDAGIVRVLRLPVRLAVGRSQVEGTLHRTYRHKGHLYVATRTRLYRQGDLSASGSLAGATSLEEVEGIEAGTWFLMSAGDVLLAGTVEGIYALDDQGNAVRAEKLCSHLAVAFFRSQLFPDRIFFGSRSGLRSLYHDGEAWRCDEAIAEVGGLVYELIDGVNGEMLLRTSNNQGYQLTFPGGLGQAPEVRQFALPEGANELLVIDGKILLSNRHRGVFRYQGLDTVSARSPRGNTSFPFEPDPSFGYLRPDGTKAQLLIDFEPEHGRLWLETEDFVEVAERPGPEAAFERRRLASDLISYWCDVHRDSESGLYWLTNGAGVYLWDPALKRICPEPHAYVRDVRRLRDGSDLLRGRASPVLPYEDNALRFEFAAPVFDQLGGSEYQYKLEGFDDGWSGWTTETAKEYTNLREQTYRFRVRARDRWHELSREAGFAFEILPPVYRTVWAYSLYALALAAVVALAVQLHQKRLTHERSINRRLREIDRLRDEFLANTSHELRTPLYGIVGLAESLLDSAAGVPDDGMPDHGLPDHARAGLSTIAQGGRRLGTLVDDILDFSKLRRHNLELALASVELRALTDVVLALAGPLAADKQLELVNSVDAALPPARADANRVQQILHNLVGNAIKYTDSGRVEVSARMEGEHLEVSVRDTGIGIAEDQLERVFESFVQADASIRRRAGGTGLGLAVSRQLVELHGGTLRVESALGRGSAFFFTLPVAVGEEEAKANMPEAVPVITMTTPGDSKSSNPAGPTILAVDDEPMVRQVLENHLCSAGYQVLTASSGAEALEILERQRVDLVLLDVMMPKMSGYEVCRTVRRTRPIEELPILFLSAMQRSEDRVAGLDQGGNDFLAKPIAKAELLSRVVTHLELLEAQRRKEREVVSLRGLLPICVRCKKIRDDEGLWNQIEAYVSQHSEAEFSHGICPGCVEELYPGLLDDEDKKELES